MAPVAVGSGTGGPDITDRSARVSSVARVGNHRLDLSEHGVKVGGLRWPASVQRVERPGPWPSVTPAHGSPDGRQRGYAGVRRWRIGTSPSIRILAHAKFTDRDSCSKLRGATIPTSGGPDRLLINFGTADAT